MTTPTITSAFVGDDTVPSAVEELCLRHDEACSRMQVMAESVDAELSGPLSREDRNELAGAIGDVADDLSELLRAKLESGFFDGFDESQRSGERLSHLQSDYRRLLSELRRIQNEIAAGKPRKARRQLGAWTNQFADVLDHEMDLVDELWSFDDIIAA